MNALTSFKQQIVVIVMGVTGQLITNIGFYIDDMEVIDNRRYRK